MIAGFNVEEEEIEGKMWQPNIFFYLLCIYQEPGNLLISKLLPSSQLPASTLPLPGHRPALEQSQSAL